MCNELQLHARQPMLSKYHQSTAGVLNFDTLTKEKKMENKINSRVLEIHFRILQLE
jgi:hypothetical protein